MPHAGGQLGHGGACIGHGGAADRRDLLGRLGEPVLVRQQIDEQLATGGGFGRGLGLEARPQLGAEPGHRSRSPAGRLVERAGQSEAGGGLGRRRADQLDDARHVGEGGDDEGPRQGAAQIGETLLEHTGQGT